MFRTSLKPRLDEISAGPPAEKPLAIDAVMVSHIDEDHILGILDLFGTLRDADERQAPRAYQPRWLLHNSFDGLVGEGEGGAARAMSGETVLASLSAVCRRAAGRQGAHRPSGAAELWPGQQARLAGGGARRSTATRRTRG